MPRRTGCCSRGQCKLLPEGLLLSPGRYCECICFSLWAAFLCTFPLIGKEYSCSFICCMWALWDVAVRVRPVFLFCFKGSDAKPCPNGTYGKQKGLGSAEECSLCPAGKYCYRAGAEPSGIPHPVSTASPNFFFQRLWL